MKSEFGTSLALVLLLGSFSFSGLGDEKTKKGAGVQAAHKGDGAATKAPESSPTERTNTGGAPIDPKTYVIGPEDVIAVQVWREPELSGLKIVRPDGKISMPLIKEIQAAGLTPVQLAAAISEGLSQKLVRPEVTVSVQQVNSKRYFLQGEVLKTGAFPLLIPTTVLEALVNAGGFREFANPKKITIIRGPKRFYFNYKEVIKGKNREQNIYLEPGDIIVVP